MPKIAYFTVLSVVVLIILTAINIRGVNASEEIKFVPVRVLAQDQSDYRADGNLIRFHRVSEAIVADAARDFTPPDSVTTIPYTIPPHNPGPAADDQQPSVTGPENEREDDVSGPNQDDGSDQEQDQDKDKNKDKDKDNGKDKDKDKDQGKDNNKDKDKGVGDKNNKDKNK